MSAVGKTRVVRSERRIALIAAEAQAESTARAMQVVTSVVTLFQNSTRSQWSIDTDDVADVVVVAHGHEDASIDAWCKVGKRVLVISEVQVPEDPRVRTLVFPFRPEQLVEALDKIDAELGSPMLDLSENASAAPAKESVIDSAERWSVVEAIRILRNVRNTQLWLAASTSQGGKLWVRSDGSCYATDIATLKSIRQGASAIGAFSPEPTKAPPSFMQFRSGTELCWYVGFRADKKLASWLDASASYRMSRWPDFGLIRPGSAVIRIAASLALSPGTIKQVAKRTKTKEEDVTRTFNALATCDMLVKVDVGQTEVAATAEPINDDFLAPPKGGFGSFLKKMRKRLGLGK